MAVPERRVRRRLIRHPNDRRVRRHVVNPWSRNWGSRRFYNRPVLMRPLPYQPNPIRPIRHIPGRNRARRSRPFHGPRNLGDRYQ
jgi:hypothetical protein